MGTTTRSSRAVFKRLIRTLVILTVVRPVALAAAPLPASDVVQNFSAPPPAEWTITGPLAWDRYGGAMLSSTTANATALWNPGWYYTGTLTCWVKLIAGRSGVPPKASLLFARDPGTGASRWVSITAGPAGAVALGQSGTIRGSAARTIKSVRTSVPFNTWQKLSLKVDGAGRVTVTLGSRPLFAAVAGPLAPGAVGFSSERSKVAFRGFSFANNPDAEPCSECHAGQAEPLAKNVYTYWDGSWWDSNQGGSAAIQQGGHGDPGGKAAAGCAGATGCHDQRLPTPGDHRNGFREPFSAPTTNTFHLKAEFFTQYPGNNPAGGYAPQVAMDNYCYKKCHETASPTPVAYMGHMASSKLGDPTLPDYGAVEMGTHLTPTNPDVIDALPIILDKDLTTNASQPMRYYAPCVACHDVHGTGTLDTGQSTLQPTTGKNHMLRRKWVIQSDLCGLCHI